MLGLFRDFERLAGVAATAGGAEQAPDPVHALIAEHRAAYAEWDRLSKVWGDCVFGSVEERAAHLVRMHAEYRLDELAAAVRGRPVHGQSEPSLFDQIIGCWREWIAASGPDETDAEREAWDRITARRDALLDAAEELAPTLENLPVKALALAWLEYVGIWENGLARDGYAISGRLALDIDAAIGGRFRTGA